MGGFVHLKSNPGNTGADIVALLPPALGAYRSGRNYKIAEAYD
jgi:hypothetical protein